MGGLYTERDISTLKAADSENQRKNHIKNLKEKSAKLEDEIDVLEHPENRSSWQKIVQGAKDLWTGHPSAKNTLLHNAETLSAQNNALRYAVSNPVLGMMLYHAPNRQAKSQAPAMASEWLESALAHAHKVLDNAQKHAEELLQNPQGQKNLQGKVETVLGHAIDEADKHWRDTYAKVLTLLYNARNNPQDSLGEEFRTLLNQADNSAQQLLNQARLDNKTLLNKIAKKMR